MILLKICLNSFNFKVNLSNTRKQDRIPKNTFASIEKIQKIRLQIKKKSGNFGANLLKFFDILLTFFVS